MAIGKVFHIRISPQGVKKPSQWHAKKKKKKKGLIDGGGLNPCPALFTAPIRVQPLSRCHFWSIFRETLGTLI